MNKSKNILITGASTGIGCDLARIFANNDYQVYGSVRRQEDAARLKEELGPNFHALLFDVTNHRAIDEAAEKLSEKLGDEGLGALVNNAGVVVPGPLVDIDIEDYRYQFDVNVIGVVKVTQAFLPLLGARENHKTEPGRIIQISSVSGKFSVPFLSAYAGSKHALEGLSNSLRAELQLFGIDVIIIGPGPIVTPIWKKSDVEEEQLSESTYRDSLVHFKNVIIKKSLKRAWTSERAAQRIYDIFQKAKPKTRYTLVSGKLTNWFLPRILPDRMLDRFMKKALKL